MPAGTVAAAPAGDPSCPVEVPGTSVIAEDAGKGAALAFVTTGDVAEVRRRVAEMARMHNEEHGKMGPLPSGDEPAGMAGHDHGAMAAGEHAGHKLGGGDAHAGHDMAAPAGGAMRMGVHSRAVVEETPGGARLVFIVAPADLAKLRDELGMHMQHLMGGTCKMSHSK